MARPCPENACPDRRPEDRPRKGGALRVFLVDDHADVRLGFRLLLERNGIEVCGEAGDLASAREGIAQSCPDLALVDLSLGSEDGAALIREQSEKNPPLPCLAVSLHEGGRWVSRALEAGAGGYVAKRDAAVWLVKAARACLGGERCLSPRATAALD